jgi:hypothetical protein
MHGDFQQPHDRFRRLVQRVLSGGIPQGVDFDSCRAVLVTEIDEAVAYHALCRLLEGALADASLSLDETQDLVPLLQGLARGTVTVRDLL